MILGVIPARSGSKRIPLKNIKNFFGKPILAYSIESAKASGVFDKIIVSTDDEAVAKVAREHGAEAPFLRPDDISGDFSPVASVAKHAIQYYEDECLAVDMACVLFATAPFMKAEYIRKGYELMREHPEKSFALSVTPFTFPIKRGLRINDQGELDALWPEHYLTRSQDLESCYHECGQFFWGRSESFLEEKMTYSPDSLPVVIPEHLVHDIDTEQDWVRCEHLYFALKETGELE
jgi:pseudaminic acid cytidylyltransferase